MHVVPQKDPRWHRHSDSRITIGLAVFLLLVSADWKLQCNEPKPSEAVYVAYSAGPWAVIPVVGA
jgi:hypothetical protein